jgi:choline dehydrogenase-like flavoprotein
MMAFSASRPAAKPDSESFGAEMKNQMSQVGDIWSVYIMMQGETVPKYENHVRLSDQHKDQWGVPQLITSIDYDQNDELMLKDFHQQAQQMLELSGCKNIHLMDSGQAPGLDIHEMGGVRMGKDPKTSLLNEWNQLHQCKNVFVTDGAAMTSTGNQNPSITFMALTARAANYAVQEIKKGNL